MGVFVQVPLVLFHPRQGTHPHQISCDLHDRNGGSIATRQGVRVQRGGLVVGEVCEHPVCNKIGRVDHGPGQSLIQIGHGCEQTSRIREHPVPPCLLREDERKATFLPLAAPLWPEEDRGGSGWLTRIGVDDYDPVAVGLFKPGRRDGS